FRVENWHDYRNQRIIFHLPKSLFLMALTKALKERCIPALPSSKPSTSSESFERASIFSLQSSGCISAICMECLPTCKSFCFRKRKMFWRYQISTSSSFHILGRTASTRLYPRLRKCACQYSLHCSFK